MRMSNQLSDNSKPVKIVVDDVPYYKRNYVLPITSAIQSKESWRWPPPEPPNYELIDRILNTTTLTTQCLTHKHILEIGDKAQNDLTADLKERIAEIEKMQKSFVSIVGQEVQKVKVEMEARYKKLLAKYMSEQQGNMTDKWETKLTAMLELEKEKVLRLNVEWKLRLEDALFKQQKELEEMHREKLQEVANAAEDHIRGNIDERVSKALQKQLETLEIGFRDRMDKKVFELNSRHDQDMAKLREELAQQHENETGQIKFKWQQMCERYKQLLEFSRNVERDYILLEEDFKRFINNVTGAGGQFGSDYLYRSRMHGLVVMPNDKSGSIKLPDFEGMEKQSEDRQFRLTELSATFDDPEFFPEHHFPPSKEEKAEAAPPYDGMFKLPLPRHDKIGTGNLIPVKLVRPLDSDEIGNLTLPVRLPEKNGSAFILSLQDF